MQDYKPMLKLLVELEVWPSSESQFGNKLRIKIPGAGYLLYDEEAKIWWFNGSDYKNKYAVIQEAKRKWTQTPFP